MFEKFHRGDIYSADLSPGIGSEQSGSRPVLILQNNVGNCFSPTIIIAAITSVSKKSRKFPTHYHLNDRCGLVNGKYKQDALVQSGDYIKVPKGRIIFRLCK